MSALQRVAQPHFGSRHSLRKTPQDAKDLRVLPRARLQVEVRPEEAWVEAHLSREAGMEEKGVSQDTEIVCLCIRNIGFRHSGTGCAGGVGCIFSASRFSGLAPEVYATDPRTPGASTAS